MTSLFRLRPRYRHQSALTADQLRARVSAALAAPGATCRGRVDDDKLEIMPRGDHHFWTPELRAFVEPTDGGGCLVTGRYGPAPAVWTMFAVIYIHLAFISVAGGVYAMAQLTLGDRPTALWAVPICLVLALVVRLAAHVGQNLGADQLETIRDFVDRAVESEP